MSSTTAEETAQKAPPTLAILSKYSQYHLDAATSADTPGLEKASTDGLRGSDTSSDSGLYIAQPPTSQPNAPSNDDAGAARDAQVSEQSDRAESAPSSSSELENTIQNVPSTEGLSKFLLFGELPTELQDQIWRATMNPRIVELRAREVDQHLYPAQRSIKMWNVSKQKRDEALSAHGYMPLKIPARRDETSPCTFVINPNIDMLYISIWTDCSLAHTRLLESLKASNLIDKIRCVALDYTETRNEDGSMNDWIRDLNLQGFSNLELVLIILQAQNQDWPPEESGLLSRFELFVEDDSSRDEFPWIAPDITVFKHELQEKWARGPERTTPQIVFVEEFYKRPIYWDLEDQDSKQRYSDLATFR
ncbi:uncharacterized protein PAC_16513 [Phialocephala subalpina]|uniref:2EXR domain-containing protein n=1 Tax=Phialocephala subalpina TaxID=576137 RepID=A0A1L7XNK9_9HELO|nr:uncharacterized protein PAC_16513 [Phialocephala subalpina]